MIIASAETLVRIQRQWPFGLEARHRQLQAESGRVACLLPSTADLAATSTPEVELWYSNQVATTGHIELISSAALAYENLMSPLVERREYVTTYLNIAATFVPADAALLLRAREFEARGMRPLDALHLASAERGRARWFITCDDRILKRARGGKLETRLEIGTPVEFVASRKKTNGES